MVHIAKQKCMNRILLVKKRSKIWLVFGFFYIQLMLNLKSFHFICNQCFHVLYFEIHTRLTQEGPKWLQILHGLHYNVANIHCAYITSSCCLQFSPTTTKTHCCLDYKRSQILLVLFMSSLSYSNTSLLASIFYATCQRAHILTSWNLWQGVVIAYVREIERHNLWLVAHRNSITLNNLLFFIILAYFYACKNNFKSTSLGNRLAQTLWRWPMGDQTS